MANFNDIKHEIDQNVNTNGVQAITGAILNETLKDMIDEVDAKKQDTLVAGANITISGNVISASGGGSGETYTAGHGIDISSGNEISVDTAELAGYGLNNTDYQFNVDTSVIQGKLTAGANIQINGDTISATDTNTTYSAGSGLNLNGTTFSVDSSSLAGSGLEVDEFGALKTDPSVVQSKLTAGDGIEIDGSNEISVKAGSGLGFDANGYLINTGGGGGGTTYTAGDGIEIDSNDAINAKLGNGLQLDQNNNIEIDPSVVATQNDLAGKQDTLTAGNGIDISAQDVISVDPNDLAGNGLAVNQSGYLEPDFTVVASQSDLSSYLRNDASGTVQNFLDGTGDTELTVMDGMSEDYVRLGAYETQGEQPHIEIFENGSGDTKFFYDHIERGSQVSIDLPSSSGTLALTSDIPTVPTASSLAGNGLQDDGNGALEIDTTVVATQSDLSGYLPLTGGTLNNTGQINTNLSVQSPNSDYHVNTYVPNSGSVEIEIGMSSGHAVQNPSDGDTKNLRVYKDKVDLYTYDSGTSNWRADSLYFPKKKTGTIALDSDLAGKQDTLVSGTNIKTINGNSLLGSGDITISGGQSYTAGNGIDITSGTISVDVGSGLGFDQNGALYATGGGGTTYTAGTGISIDANNQISAKIANGYGLGTNLNGELLVDAGALAGNGLQVDQNGQLEVVGGGGGSGLWTSGTGTDSLLSIPAQNSNGTAAGNYALSSGWYTTASADNSVALGNQTTASRTNAFAAGKQSTASGISSVAIGDVAAASGDYSVALGSLATASGTRSFATSNATASNTNAVALGDGADATALLSTAIGTSAKATNTSEIALGKWNKSTSTGTDADKTQFSIGNGTALGSESNIIEAKKNNDVYLYGVGGFTGANYSNAQTLQDVINNAGGGGNYLPLTGGTLQDTPTGSNPDDTSLVAISPNNYSTIGIYAKDFSNASGEGELFISDSNGIVGYKTTGINTGSYTLSFPTLSQNETIATLSDISGGQSYSAGQGIDITNNTISVDNTIATVSDLRGYLPLTGGSLQDDSAGATDTSLGIMSPGSGDVSITMQVLQDEATSHITIETNAFNETEPGKGESISDFNVNNHGDSGISGTVSSNFVDDGNGGWVRDDFDSSISFAAPAGQGITAEVYIDAYSSNLSDPGNETSEALISLTDIRGNIEFNPTGFNDGTYTLGFPSLSQNETIATLSDIPSASSLAGDGLQDDGNGALEVKLGSGLQLDANGAIETTGGGSGSSLWESGTGSGSLIPLGGASSQNLQAGGDYSIALGSGANASGDYSFAHSGGTASGDYSFAIESGVASGVNSIALGGNASGTGSGAVGLYSSASGQASLAIGLGTQATNQGESAYGTFNLSTTSATPADATHFSIGLGTQNSRRNELEIKQNADAYLIGVGGYDGTNASQAQSLQTVINSKQNQLVSGVDVKTINGQSIVGSGNLVISGGSGLWTNGTGTDSLVAPGTVSSSLSLDPASGDGAISCGYDTNADGDFAFAQGGASSASGDYAFAANNGTASGNYSTAFGSSGANGYMSFAAGNGATANADRSIALGNSASTIYDDSDPYAIINAEDSVAIGNGAITNNRNAVALGTGAMANGIDSVAIGVNSIANGQESYAIGSSANSEGLGSVALVGNASGEYSVGMATGSAIGTNSVAGGTGAIASIASSVALGFQTMTYDQNDPADTSDPQAGEIALGRYNYTDQNFIFSVGCGKEVYHDPQDPDFYPNPDDPDNPDGWTEIIRENAITITTDGSIYIKGLGQYTGTQISGATSLQTFLNNL